jgi:transcription initiation factor IIE alpha subunit
MNNWLQTKQYPCPACRERYLHDKAYHHALFLCPARCMTGPARPTVSEPAP